MIGAYLQPLAAYKLIRRLANKQERAGRAGVFVTKDKTGALHFGQHFRFPITLSLRPAPASYNTKA
jgi:hypothetical protein